MNENDKGCHMVSFRCPQHLLPAMEKAAAEEMASISHIVRIAVLKELRMRGLMEPVTA
jgi:hypothetical protein